VKLYFSPLACSLACRIALYEAGIEATYVEVDLGTKKSEDGRDYREIHPLGLVPALELGPGEIVTENAAVLQYIAALAPGTRLGADDARSRAELQRWLSFIGTELHKAIYQPLMDATAPAEAKAHVLTTLAPPMTWLAERLEKRAFLLDGFTVADAYLYAVLNWSAVAPVDLGAWPAIAAYHARLRERPAVARAFSEERALYARQLARHGEAPFAPVLTTSRVIERFNGAFQQHDPAALPALVAEHCVLENTGPAPDGSRHVGRDACLAVWQSIAANRAARFELERVDVLGQRALIHWRHLIDERPPIRGVSLMRVEHGRIVEALGYVKSG